MQLSSIVCRMIFQQQIYIIGNTSNIEREIWKENKIQSYKIENISIFGFFCIWLKYFDSFRDTVWI